MNYYEHHIKDYAAATDHLSWDEDMAYTRLLRRYYRKEQPLPPDLDEVCRLVRAATEQQRSAVAVVLGEFFELCSDGYHNDVCDAAIEAFRAGKPDREAKKTNEDTRLQRHRDERRQLFTIINSRGEHRPWNTPIGDLRALVSALQAPVLETPPAMPAATATATPATATQTPDTRHQTPVLNTEPPPPPLQAEAPATPATPATAPMGGDEPPADRTDEARNRDRPPVAVTVATAAVVAMRSAGLAKVNGSDPRLLALLERGANLQHFADAGRAAIDAKARDPFAYALRIVQGQLDEAHALAAAPRPLSGAVAPPMPTRKAQAQAAVIGALTGRSNPERTANAIRSDSAIDVDSRIVGRS